jgi:ABC-type nickel/cobalt efflux system permease component RcnA
MRRILTLIALAALALTLWLWTSGGFDQLARYAAEQQRGFQNDMAGMLRALRGGQAGAFWGLMGLSFAYGFFHAVGPGHGKVLIGGYGMGRKVAAMRLTLIGFLASMGQAVTAVLLVYSGIWLLNFTRETLIGVTEDIMAPVSYAAIGAIGLWLVWRGVQKLLRRAPADTHIHAHDAEGGHCSECGHRHAPSLEEVSQIRSLREALGLIGGIAIRPCTGALFVLIITWQMGIGLAGVAAAFAMALGTASVTVAVGLAAIGLRGGLLASLNERGALVRVVPVVELLAGAVIAVIAAGLLLRAL